RRREGREEGKRKTNSSPSPLSFASFAPSRFNGFFPSGGVTMAVATKIQGTTSETGYDELVARTRRRRKIESILIDKVLAYGFLIVMSIFALFPFAWMFSTSIKTPQE